MFKRLTGLSAALLLAACSTIRTGPPVAPLDKSAQWALLPIVNQTETPQAGLRAEALVESGLRNGGILTLQHYPVRLNQETLLEPAERKAADDARQWAAQQGMRYAVTGAVTEWRYKVGVDGEPAVGMALQVIDLKSGQVVWSGSGGKTGFSRESLAGTAQKLVNQLLAGAGLE
ncbi:MAG: penicillin-binding protein activator LpoB [Chitinivorax sp.]